MKIGNELQFSLMNKAINEQKAAENTSANKIYKAKNNDVEVTKTAQDFVALFYQQFLGVMMPPDKADPIFGKAYVMLSLQNITQLLDKEREYLEKMQVKLLEEIQAQKASVIDWLIAFDQFVLDNITFIENLPDEQKEQLKEMIANYQMALQANHKALLYAVTINQRIMQMVGEVIIKQASLGYSTNGVMSESVADTVSIAYDSKI
jgi:hypothetical protein